jgi:hypothetical protein
MDGRASNTLFKGPLNRFPAEKQRVPRADFHTNDEETANRLARAFNHMRELCHAQPPDDPFATSETR